MAGLQIDTTTLAQTVDGVARVEFTPIEQDPATGLYVREIRIYGASNSGEAQSAASYTVRLQSTTQGGLQVQTPPIRV